MRVKVRQVGNSLTVTIPKEIALDLGITPKMEMDVSIKDRVVVLEPAESRWERLLAETRKLAFERGLTETDVDEAIAESRDRAT
ncbi:MAG: AbrB/MazE/SpoVT family DNA-binding domain-containing protein [Thermoleophilia bacterium]|nr:AbrB/MazE/SpoVT family DNA-binding domain-containing protein [Thermoleophilia bacterium]